jgi:hypothetical protein
VLVPVCDAVIVQVPVLLSVTVAEEILLAIDWLAIMQGPVALKFTCNPFGTPPDKAVAVTVVCETEILTELGNGPRLMVWSFLSTAGGDGALWRCVGSIGTGSRVVDIV